MARRRRNGSNRRRSSRRSKSGIFGMSPKFMLGLVAGYMGLDDPIDNRITMGLAVAPVNTGGLGTVARGVIGGELIRSQFGSIGSSTGTSPGGAV